MNPSALYNLAMTANTYTDADNNTFIASASTVYVAGTAAFKPFNGVASTSGENCWHPLSGVPQWLQLQLSEPMIIRGFTLKNRSSNVEHPTAITFQGSNDGTNWDDLGQISWTETGSNLSKDVTIPAYTTGYTYFRWYITAVTSSPYGVIAKIIFTDVSSPRTTKYLLKSGSNYYSIISNVLTNVGSTLNAQLFADYGMNDIPDWSDYSSLSNPSVLCWDNTEAVSMTATTSGVPSANAVVSQNVPTGDGVQTVTIASDNATLYSVSFDNGSTWWKYASNAWTQVSSISDGMTKAEVEAISASAWGEKNTGFARFRFTLLDGNGYMTSIRVDYAGGGGDSVEWTQIQQSGTKIAEIDINGTTQDVYAPNGGSTYTEGDGIDISAQNAISVDTTFTEASTRANIESGDTLETIWGKIKKFFTDLKTVAFTGAYSDLTGTPSNLAYTNVNNGFSANQTIDRADGTTSNPGSSGLTLGNNIPNGTEGNSRASIRMYGNREYYVDVRARSITGDRAIELPDDSGTVALTSDVDKCLKANQTLLTANTSTQFTLAKGEDYLLITLASASNLKSTYIIHVTSGQTPAISWIPLMDASYGTKLSLSSSANVLTVTSTSTSNATSFLVRLFDGS